LRNDNNKEAETLYAVSDDIVNDLTPQELNVAQESSYLVRPEEIFSNFTTDCFLPPISILSKSFNRYLLRYDSIYMQPETKEANEVYQQIGNLLNKNKKGVKLQKGDLLIIDNRITSHARSKFKALYNGTDRWLQRLQLFCTPPVKDSHIITTDFIC